MRKVPVFLRGGRLAGLAQDDLQHDDDHDGRNADQVGRQLRVDQAQAAGFINLWGLPTKVQALREQGKL